MSIPKEPRQLMINLMYIVLTALLALNVSAEVMQALFSMDKSLNESSKLVEGSNEKLAAAIEEQADAYSQYEPFKEKVRTTQKVVNDFFKYTTDLRTEIIEAAGGEDENGLPKKKDNKDVSTRLMLKQGKAEVLKKEIIKTRELLLNLVDDEAIRTEIAKNIPLRIREIPADSDKKNWSEFNFQQMPVAAILPLLSKFENDAKISETAILNYFLGQTDVVQMKPDAFEAVIAADRSYVIKGEEISGEVFLGAYSSTADNISISINGKTLPVRDGKASFIFSPDGLGTKEMQAKIRPQRSAFETALSLTVMAARAHGKIVIDGVYNSSSDEAGLASECEQGREFGFDGKTLIHPDQLEAANRIFAPSRSALDDAKAIIAAFAEPENEGKGVIDLDGTMVERLHLAEAEGLVAMADAIAAREEADA